MHRKGLEVLINKNKNRCRQYYQYYSTQETVCSNARSQLLCRCYRYLQQEKSTPTGPPIREVRNEIKSLQVSRRREPVDPIVYHKVQVQGTDTRVVCTVQCAESTPVRTRTGVVQAQPSRLRQYCIVKAQRQKRRAR